MKKKHDCRSGNCSHIPKEFRIKKPAHTPLPWTFDNDVFEGRIYITPENRPCHYVADINSKKIDREGDYPTNKQREANAELIVRAVNNHNALLAHLEAVMKFWTSSTDEDMPAKLFDGAWKAIRNAKGK